ncbi:MAG: regulatory protein RecX [Actinomycetota bacterium]
MAARAVREPKNPKSCHERALGLLAVRPRSSRELERRLLAAGFEREEVTEVLGRLEAVGLVDDQAFARAVAEHGFGTRRSGAMAVRQALSQKGVAPETVAAVVAEFGGGEDERALVLARSRVGRLAGLPPHTAHARLVGLLARRGYPGAVARRAARLALELDEGDAEA